jgi:hypothetical protein
LDFGNALLPGFIIFLLVELYTAIEEAVAARDWKAVRKIVFIILAGQVAILATAHSDWGDKNVVEGISLNVMNGVSLAIAGLAVAGLMAFGNKVAVKALSRIGSSGEL